jgi:hypothetical protein
MSTPLNLSDFWGPYTETICELFNWFGGGGVLVFGVIMLMFIPSAIDDDEHHSYCTRFCKPYKMSIWRKFGIWSGYACFGCAAVWTVYFIAALLTHAFLIIKFIVWG